jgi:hypothetical protein
MVAPMPMYLHPQEGKKEAEKKAEEEAARLQAGAPHGEAAMPPRWEIKMAPSSGRPVYINHLTQTTQWESPAVAIPAAMPVATPASSHGTEPVAKANLPPGWEIRVDPATGKVFYIDHFSKTSHWEHPGMVTNHVKHAARQEGTAEAAANAKAAAENAAAKAQARAAADEALAKAAAGRAAAQKAAAQKATAGNDNGGNDFSSASAQR